MKQIHKFIHLPHKEKLLFVEALFFLFFSKFLLFLPFKYCMKKVKRKQQLFTNADHEILKEICIAVRRANRFAIWKNVCLVQSFAARFMLQRRNIASTMYLGLQLKNEKEIAAHAWLLSNDVYITPKGRTPYKEIFNF